jgi:hypothetical protein
MFLSWFLVPWKEHQNKYVPEIYINPFYFIQWVNPKEHIEKQLLSLQETNLSCKNIHWLCQVYQWHNSYWDKLHKKVFVYFQEDYVNVILETYVEELIQGNNKLLVAHYTSTLPPDSQVMWCAKFLEGINSLFVPSWLSMSYFSYSVPCYYSIRI